MITKILMKKKKIKYKVLGKCSYSYVTIFYSVTLIVIYFLLSM